MRTLLSALAVLTLLVPVGLADGKDKEKEKPKPQKVKAAYVVFHGKGFFYNIAVRPFTVRTDKPMVFEYIGKVPDIKKVRYRVRIVNGDEMIIKGHECKLVMWTIKLPSEKAQKACYKSMLAIKRMSEAKAKKRTEGMDGDTDYKFFCVQYSREMMLYCTAKWKLTRTLWLKIKAIGDKKGWVKPKKEKK